VARDDVGRRGVFRGLRVRIQSRWNEMIALAQGVALARIGSKGTVSCANRSEARRVLVSACLRNCGGEWRRCADLSSPTSAFRRIAERAAELLTVLRRFRFNYPEATLEVRWSSSAGSNREPSCQTSSPPNSSSRNPSVARLISKPNCISRSAFPR